MEEQTSTAVAISKPVGIVNPRDTADWAEVFRKSGLFSSESSNVEVQTAQAQVKILAGAEMGLQPFFAMQNLYIVKQHVFVSAAAFGALVNGNSTTKFVTKESTKEKAVIEFYRRDGDAWELAHTQTYTMADAEGAGRAAQDTYKRDPADMLWNRCMTKGAKKACPELVGGMRSVEEAQDEAEWSEADGNGAAGLLPEATARVVDSETGEITKEPDAQEAAPASKATAEKPAEKPATKAKGKGKAELPAEPVKPAEPAKPETGAPMEKSQHGSEPDDLALDKPVGDIAEQPITEQQMAEVGLWNLSEKFDVPAAAKRLGWHLTKLSEANQGQYHELKKDRDEYIKAAAQEFGWNLPEDLTTTHDQHLQLQKRAQAGTRRV